MEIQITATNVRYSENKISTVQVQFQGIDTEHSINLNGHMALTAEEYVENITLPGLTQVVRRKVIERLELQEAK